MSVTPTPIIVPVQTQPDLCPKCGRVEDTVEVCRHCRYEYPADTGSWTDAVVIAGLVVAICWVIFTVGWWLVDQSEYGDRRTLVEIIVAQWEFVKRLRPW